MSHLLFLPLHGLILDFIQYLNLMYLNEENYAKLADELLMIPGNSGDK